jgi:hypothetical protein
MQKADFHDGAPSVPGPPRKPVAFDRPFERRLTAAHVLIMRVTKRAPLKIKPNADATKQRHCEIEAKTWLSCNSRKNLALTSARTKTSVVQMLNVSRPARIDSSLTLTLMRAEIER